MTEAFGTYLIILSGAYDDEEAAAHAYDLAALKYWGQDTILNFPVICLSVYGIFFTLFFNRICIYAYIILETIDLANISEEILNLLYIFDFSDCS